MVLSRWVYPETGVPPVFGKKLRLKNNRFLFFDEYKSVSSEIDFSFYVLLLRQDTGENVLVMHHRFTVYC